MNGRLKGKAWKLATQAEAEAAEAAAAATPDSALDRDADQDDNASCTIVSATQFVTLARFIAAKRNPPVAVPPRVIDWAARAIRARRQCAEWFQLRALATLADPENGRSDSVQVETERSNKSHEHFIGILESVIAILSPRIRSEYGTAKVNLASIAVELDEGRFAALAQEEMQAEAAGLACVDGPSCGEVGPRVAIEEPKPPPATSGDVATSARDVAQALLKFIEAYMNFLSDA
ncbi:hypothetical protein BCR44DRAFT_1425673 [Catenaria anguillulae PL171]|uniref:DUF6604 domain-containing protein n=1 Tax=Catenaria anguillulae PL171 TaxID=765915 RepID=A0A1Y2I0R4_9FUNG|nr:hypothetical protein BCR44DRAFT_1425673 [Catenaria anguillulae PL171]